MHTPFCMCPVRHACTKHPQSSLLRQNSHASHKGIWTSFSSLFQGEGLLAGAAAEMDAKAIETLQEAYGPDYKVVGVRSREVLLNAGNIHCITQQWVKAG